MNAIKQKYLIKAPIEKVWEALTNEKVINSWGGGPARMDGKKGTRFKFWGGDIFGENTEVVPNKKLVQNWYAGKWDKPSIVTFDLSYKNGVTAVNLTHTDVPGYEAKDIEMGWKDYYMIPLKEFVEKEN